MKYDTPELREQLAAEYVLGTMPVLARQRFERLLGGSADLRRAVADWNDRFAPIDGEEDALEPPPRIWRAIERRLDLSPPPVAAAEARGGWFASLAFWRGATLAAAALAALAFVYIAVREPSAPTAPTTANIVAILNDDSGKPGWIATGNAGGDIAVAPIRSVALDAQHAFQLWAIAEGKPQPLGLLDPHPGGKLTLQAARIPANSVLAVSIEPAGGSPTGLPTGPVPYKGAVLPR